MSREITFTTHPPGFGRIHYVNEQDAKVILSRLPESLWQRLRSVQFNDMSMGNRRLGYVTRRRTEIALCALPKSLTLRLAMRSGQTPEEFGANRSQKWAELAVRRFMLYDVFLHELGHLQLVDPNRPSKRLRFAHEKLAQKFANRWRKLLWAQPFDHVDPVHNPPCELENSILRRSATVCELVDRFPFPAPESSALENWRPSRSELRRDSLQSS